MKPRLTAGRGGGIQVLPRLGNEFAEADKVLREKLEAHMHQIDVYNPARAH